MNDPSAMNAIEATARRAREASRILATLPTATKNRVLSDLADSIQARRAEIAAANAEDLAASRAAGLPEAKLRRLALTDEGLAQLATGLRQVADLPDPVGMVTRSTTAPSGLRIRRVRAPLGVIAMIYEARPGVTIDAFALCFKAGNACLLKGGREAARTNEALAGLARSVLTAQNLPEDAVSLITTSDRDELRLLLSLSEWVDLVIPRGGVELIRFVREHSRIPTIQHYQGVCHIYIDVSADLGMAENIAITAKTSAPATCNAAECLLIHRGIAPVLIPRLAERFAKEGVEVRGDPETCRLAPLARPAAEDDWGREFLDLIIAIKVVGGLEEAIGHIHRYSSSHTESIITRDAASAEAFTSRITSSCVLVNASTRFNDGFQLGLGAEIGISTSRIHAYGPMGLEELTIQRYIVHGEGQTR